MASPFPTSVAKLDCPLFAIDFDPRDANRIVVGGGGGAGRSGVGNKISVLETSSPTELRVAGDIDLSRDEDSVMSLALGPSAAKGRTTFLYAGVNSSPASIAKGKNEHLRTLAVDQASSRKSASGNPASTKVTPASVYEVSRTAMFTDPDEATFQRLLRVNNGVGAAATAMGKESQLAVFEATGANPKPKGILELPKDAEDLDLVQTGEGKFQLAFCYKYELHVVNIAGKELSQPELIYTMPEENGQRPMLRSLRYLSPEFILAVSNLSGGKGVLLQALRLPSPGHDKARVAATARIDKPIKATALAVTNLTPVSSPGSPTGDTQFVIAVAANDASISLFTLENTTSKTLNLLSRLHPLHTIKDAHDAANVTSLAFSTFVTPKTHIRPQAVKLASASLGNTVVVHSIPLVKHVDRTPRNKNGPPRAVRYVVAMKSKGPSRIPLLAQLAFIALALAIVWQGFLEAYGQAPPRLGVHKVLPSWHGSLRSAEHQPPALMDHDFVAKLMGEGATAPPAGEKVVLLEKIIEVQETEGSEPAEGEEDVSAQEKREDVKEIKVDVHSDELHGEHNAKAWEDLPEEQKEAWKQKLGEAGSWTKDMGESVFRGILFGELAGAVGQAFAG